MRTVYAILQTFFLLFLACIPAQARTGLPIESAEEGGLGWQSGIRPGDIVLEWQPTSEDAKCPSRATGVDIFGWEWLTSELAPRTDVHLLVDRNREHLNLTLPAGEWQIRARSAGVEEGIYATLRRYLAEARYAEALHHAFNHADQSGSREDWILWTLLELIQIAHEHPLPVDLYSVLASLEAAERTAVTAALRPQIHLAIHQLWIDHHHWQSDHRASLERLREALRLESTLCPDGWRFHRLRYRTAEALYRLQEPEQAEAILVEVMNAQSLLAPGAPELATTQGLLGAVVAMKGRLEESLYLLRSALEIYEAQAIVTAGRIQSLIRLAEIHWWSGHLSEAESRLMEARRYIDHKPKLQREWLPKVMFHFGKLEEYRGDFDLAKSYYLQALELAEGNEAARDTYLATLRSLSRQAISRDDRRSAEHYLQQRRDLARSIAQKFMVLEDLGALALRGGNPKQAYDFFHEAHDLVVETRPESHLYNYSLIRLSQALLQMNKANDARMLLREALDLAEAVSDPWLTATTLKYLADAEYQSGMLEAALDHQERSTTLIREHLPFSTRRVLYTGRLGFLEERNGRTEKAARLYREAIGILDLLLQKLDQTALIDAQFRDGFQEIYRDYIDLLADLDKQEELVATVEGIRARSFLIRLMEQKLHLWQELPPDLEARLFDNAKAFDAKQRQIWKIAAADEMARDSAEDEIERLHVERKALLRTIRQASPRAASLRYPEPLGLSDIQQSLDAGTLMLFYNIGRESTHLFAITKSGFSSLEVAGASDKYLQEKTALVRQFVVASAGRGLLREHRRRRLHDLAAELYDLLLAPAQAEIDQAKRLVIIPDGPLHVLPWALLGTRTGAPEHTDRFRYLIEALPVHLSTSGTVYAKLKERPSRPLGLDGDQLLAFADPALPQDLLANPASLETRVRTFLEQRPNLVPLPAARMEVGRLQQIYPAAKVFMGREATEEQFLRHAREARYLHFATHSLVDERRPLNSAIVLSIPENPEANAENGLLQVWEITERLSLDADLVVLSACETALGKQIYGEGLIGLTRAFHHAGAQSVIASLWQISDDVTAQLIESFYQHLKDGQTKDQALRSAQLSLIARAHAEGPTATVSPYHWAAFQLYGDWR